MSKLLASVRSFAAGDEGATFAEYVMLCVLIALVCIAAVTIIGVKVGDFFTSIPPLQ
jgi:Flp pilus assembly pilin Flp